MTGYRIGFVVWSELRPEYGGPERLHNPKTIYFRILFLVPKIFRKGIRMALPLSVWCVDDKGWA